MVRERVLQNAAGQALPEFNGASFMCSIKGGRITMGGDMEITLVIPPNEKYRALPLTDAVGMTVQINAQRKRRVSITDYLFGQHQETPSDIDHEGPTTEDPVVEDPPGDDPAPVGSVHDPEPVEVEDPEPDESDEPGDPDLDQGTDGPVADDPDDLSEDRESGPRGVDLPRLLRDLKRATDQNDHPDPPPAAA